jgi:protein TonB
MNWASIRQFLGTTIVKLYLVSGILHGLLFAGFLYQDQSIPISSSGTIQVQLAGGLTNLLMPKSEVPFKRPPHSSAPKAPSPTPEARHKSSPIPQKNRRLQETPSSVEWVKRARTALLNPVKLPQNISGTLPTRKARISPNERPPLPKSKKRIAAEKPKTSSEKKNVSSKVSPRASIDLPKRPALPSKNGVRKNATPFQSAASLGQILNDRISAILSQILREKRYPPSARERGIEGTATVAFQIEQNGRLGFLKLQKSSGNAALDRASLEAIRRAAPFPFVPRLLVLPIRYRLTE